MRIRPAAVAALLALGLEMPAHADMLGNTLTFLRAWPTTSTPYWPNSTRSTVVAAGTSDLIDWYANPGSTGFHLTVDPEATTITWTLLSPSSFGGTGSPTFDGFVVTGFGADIVSASLQSNGTGLAVELSQGGPRELQVDLGGNNSVGSFTLAVTLVPEPTPAALLLAGLGVVALARRRR